MKSAATDRFTLPPCDDEGRSRPHDIVRRKWRTIHLRIKCAQFLPELPDQTRSFRGGKFSPPNDTDRRRSRLRLRSQIKRDAVEIDNRAMQTEILRTEQPGGA